MKRAGGLDTACLLVVSFLRRRLKRGGSLPGADRMLSVREAHDHTLLGVRRRTGLLQRPCHSIHRRAKHTYLRSYSVTNSNRRASLHLKKCITHHTHTHLHIHLLRSTHIRAYTHNDVHLACGRVRFWSSVRARGDKSPLRYFGHSRALVKRATFI